MAENAPEGGVLRSLVLSLNPQQAIAPLLRRAQLWLWPADSAVKSEPVGGVVRSLPPPPQQTSAPVLRMAQLCAPPALTAV